MVTEASFEAETQFAETGKLYMGALDNSALTTELFAGLDTSSSDACCHTSSIQRLPVLRVLVLLVGTNVVRALTGPTRKSLHQPYTSERSLKHFRVMSAGTCDHACQWNTLTVCCDMALACRTYLGQVRPDRIIPPGGGYARTIDAYATSASHIVSTQSREQRRLQAAPIAFVVPISSPTPACHTAAEAHPSRQVLKWNAGVQHEQNPFDAPQSSTQGRAPFGERNRAARNGSSVFRTLSLILRCLVT